MSTVLSSHDLAANLLAALSRDRQARSDRLADLLQEAEQLDDHLALSLPAQLRSYLVARRSSVADQLLTLLLEWWSVGGGLDLALPEELPLAEEAEPPVGTKQEPPEGVPEGVPEAELPEDEPPEDGLADDGLPDDETEEAPRPLPRIPPPIRVVATPPAPPVPPALPATPAQLTALSKHVASGQAHISPPPIIEWRPALDELLRILAPADPPLDDLEVCLRASQQMRGWTAFPRETQRQLIGLLATRLRHLQEDLNCSGPSINVAFSALTRYSAAQRPGFVVGLSREHRPEGASWAVDAQRWWDLLTPEAADAGPAETPNRDVLLTELARLMTELDLAPSQARDAVVTHAVRSVRAALDGGVHPTDARLVRLTLPLLDSLNGASFKALRRALRDAQTDGAAEPPAEHTSTPPDDWPWWGHTTGRAAVMVGGDPREANRQRIQAQLRLGELRWEDMSDKVRSAQSLRGRIQRHGVDLVIMLGGFIGHSYDDILLPACQDAGVDWVHVDHGYGLARIIAAIERFTDPLDYAGPDASVPG